MRRKRASKGGAVPSLPCIEADAAGIDVGAKEIFVAVPEDRDPQPIRCFTTFTEDLQALAAWLLACRIRTVAMESTGVYWIPVFQILEASGLEVCLVNSQHVKHVPGRKSDVADCRWLQFLHSVGLLRSSFRPEDAICRVRSLLRHRDGLVEMAGEHIQHMQKALTQMNLQLHHVLSDLTGKSGMAILDAILAGERDPAELARLRDPKCKNDATTIARALEGTWRPEHLFALRQAYELYRFHHQQIADCDAIIQEELAQLPNRAGDKSFTAKPRRCGRKPNDLGLDACEPLFQALGVDLTRIEGIEVGTALIILAEIGVDVSRFPTEKHFASWLGVCPRQYESNKSKKKRSPRKGKNRVAIALRMAAQSLGRTQSPLGLFYRRIKSRIGGKGAVTATAHKLACLVYRMLKYGTEYVQQSMQEYERKVRGQMERALQRKAAALGYQLIRTQALSAEPVQAPM